ncbi:MAG: SRPBCC family protein [Pyrinomonadaceae bacterium]
MKLYSLRYQQTLPLDVAGAWDFFSSPHNLPRITPAWLDFQLTCELPERMHAGMIISYRIRPLLGLPVNWVTEITHVNEPFFFVDEQRFGPYRFWHHQHHFRETAAGVEVEDVVHYGLKHRPFGGVLNRVLIRRRLEEIFAFRQRALARMFPPAEPVQRPAHRTAAAAVRGGRGA